MDWKDTACGVFGSLCAVFAGLPFDTVKTRMQTQVASNGVFPYRSPLDCLVKLVRKEGFLKLYSGAIPAAMSQIVENATLFTANGALRRVSVDHFGAEEPMSLVQVAILGGMAGICSGTAICPPEVIKVRLMAAKTGGGDSSTGVIDCVRKLLRVEGGRGLFRGLIPLLARDIPYNAVYLGSYEALSYGATLLLAPPILPSSEEERDDATPANSVGKSHLPLYAIIFNGGMAGVIGWSTVFPFDVVKSKMQLGAVCGASRPPTMLETARTLLAEGGVPRLYRGWSAGVLRAFPTNGAIFFGFEMSHRLLKDF